MPSKSLSRSSLLSFQKYSSLLAGNDPYIPPVPAYDLLETEILTGTQASVTFSNLNNYSTDYQHLQVRAVMRTDRNATADTASLSFNGVGGTSYHWHSLFVSDVTSASTASATGTNSLSYMRCGRTTSATTAANSFGASVIDITNPFSSTSNTTINFVNGHSSQSGVNWVEIGSGIFLNTAAITSMTFDQVFGSNFVQYSRFSLYGLRKEAA